LFGAAVLWLGAGELGRPAVAATGPIFNYRMGLVVTRHALGGELATTFIEKAKEKSNGRIVIELFDGAKLGSELDMSSGVRLGTLDMALLGSGHIATIEPSFSLTELPFIWRSPEKQHTVLDGPIGQRMMSFLEPKGIKPLVFGEWGPRDVLARTRVINSIDDVKGLKIRVIENPLYIATWRAFGASPTPMAWPEVYLGLQQGTIDAVCTNPFGMTDSKLHEVARHLAVTEHIYTAIVLIMNVKKWQGLPPDLQQILLEAAREGQKANRGRAVKENENAREIMRKAGVQVTRPDREPFRAKVEAVYKRFSAQVGPDILQQAIDAQK
jgi:tripartite ATP-independent transporter DctP family solute receptor